jgi:thioredoxin 1
MAGSINTLTDATFDETIGAASEAVVVDFWAEWCGPCKMIAPILDEIANEHAGKLAIAKLNVDDNPDIARRFDVMSIPTLIVFKDGAPQKRLVGPRVRVSFWLSSKSSCPKPLHTGLSTTCAKGCG